MDPSDQSSYDLDEFLEYPPDEKELEARKELRHSFDSNRRRVFYSRQVEVIHEGERGDKYFHWVTKRALDVLEEDGLIKTERRQLRSGSPIILIRHKSYRDYKTEAKKLVELVNEYSEPSLTEAVGDRGEMLVQDGFAGLEFVRRGRNTRKYSRKAWTKTSHDLDFIFERDSIAYGVEVKNALGYMDHDELKTKIELCKHLGIKPVFVVRMMPKNWIEELRQEGGFALILKWQLFPLDRKELAKRMRDELDLPVDAPRALEEGTMQRFMRHFHSKNLRN